MHMCEASLSVCSTVYKAGNLYNPLSHSRDGHVAINYDNARGYEGNINDNMR